jgi:hypothetical protein
MPPSSTNPVPLRETGEVALVVETVESTERHGVVVRRVSQYLGRRVPMIWVLCPNEHIVIIHRPGVLPEIHEGVDLLDLPLPFATGD